MSAKKWTLVTLALTLLLLIIVGGLTVVIDPFFHYHAPLDGLAYEMPNTQQRYFNDGIIEHYDYDILLAGTSMLENFSASLSDRLFDGRSIKVPFEGASFKEVDGNVRKAIAENEELRIVVRSLDYFMALYDKDDLVYDINAFPNYLYDDDIFNDTQYFFNKTVLFNSTLNTLRRTARGEEMMSLDEYSRMSPLLFGAKLKGEKMQPVSSERIHAAPETLEGVAANVVQNIRQTVLDNPDIEFYLFFPPYSVVHWDNLRAKGTVDEQVDVFRTVAENLVDLENAHVFAFDHRLDFICALEHYIEDGCHYDWEISNAILEAMASGEGRLTADNYEEYFEYLSAFIRETDFDLYLN